MTAGKPSTAPRTIVHAPINQYWNGTCNANSGPCTPTAAAAAEGGGKCNRFQPFCGGAIMQRSAGAAGKLYKMIVGYGGDFRHVVLPKLGRLAASAASTPALAPSLPCSKTGSGVCLFELLSDPNELHELGCGGTYADVCSSLQASLKTIR